MDFNFSFQVIQSLNSILVNSENLSSKMIKLLSLALTSSMAYMIDQSFHYSVEKCEKSCEILNFILENLTKPQQKQIMDILLEEAIQYGHFWAFLYLK